MPALHFRVNTVLAGGPADEAGLRANEDYLLGTEHKSLLSEETISGLLTTGPVIGHDAHTLLFYVYNEPTDSVRSIAIVPSYASLAPPELEAAAPLVAHAVPEDQCSGPSLEEEAQSAEDAASANASCPAPEKTGSSAPEAVATLPPSQLLESQAGAGTAMQSADLFAMRKAAADRHSGASASKEAEALAGPKKSAVATVAAAASSARSSIIENVRLAAETVSIQVKKIRRSSVTSSLEPPPARGTWWQYYGLRIECLSGCLPNASSSGCPYDLANPSHVALCDAAGLVRLERLGCLDVFARITLLPAPAPVPVEEPAAAEDDDDTDPEEHARAVALRRRIQVGGRKETRAMMKMRSQRNAIKSAAAMGIHVAGATVGISEDDESQQDKSSSDELDGNGSEATRTPRGKRGSKASLEGTPQRKADALLGRGKRGSKASLEGTPQRPCPEKRGSGTMAGLASASKEARAESMDEYEAAAAAAAAAEQEEAEAAAKGAVTGGLFKRFLGLGGTSTGASVRSVISSTAGPIDAVLAVSAAQTAAGEDDGGPSADATTAAAPPSSAAAAFTESSKPESQSVPTATTAISTGVAVSSKAAFRRGGSVLAMLEADKSAAGGAATVPPISSAAAAAAAATAAAAARSSAPPVAPASAWGISTRRGSAASSTFRTGSVAFALATSSNSSNATATESSESAAS